jgi:diadenosine tetraphosphate (Ap4A) HIT family hydrolase
VWNAHVKEMSDLAPTERDELMRAVFAVEAALIAALQPVKMNLASLGNVTPHLHWHVIPRLASDPAFPKPIWVHGLEPLASAPEAQSRLGRPDAAGMGDWKSRVRRALHAG